MINDITNEANVDTPMRNKVKRGFIPPTIYAVIDDYAKYKYRRFPLIAGSQRRLLRKFCEDMEINHVHEIERGHIAYFVGEQLTGFYTQKALIALRQFLWYCRQGGYQCISHNVCTVDQLQRVEKGVKISETPSWELQPIWAKEPEGRSIPTG